MDRRPREVEREVDRDVGHVAVCEVLADAGGILAVAEDQADAGGGDAEANDVLLPRPWLDSLVDGARVDGRRAIEHAADEEVKFREVANGASVARVLDERIAQRI